MIQISELSKAFGRSEVVRNLSVRINEGEVFSFLGPNGSGKTTTLKCLVGLIKPNSGKILVDGVDIIENPRKARESMSYLPQRVAIPDNLTSREVLAFYCWLRKLPEGRIEETLAATQFNFNGFADKQAATLSGGMLQRLGLAIASLPDVPILVLDEPMVNLDPEGTILFRKFLVGLKRQGKTILFSSHILADVEYLADRVAIMAEGRLLAVETIEALREGMMQQARIRLTMANPDQRWGAAALQAGAQEAIQEGNVLIITSSPDHRLKILRSIEAAGGVISRFATMEPTMEDIYLRYVRAAAETENNFSAS